MSTLVIVFVAVIIWMLYNIGKNELEKKENLKELEHKFLIAMSFSETYKYQVLEILKIIYEKAGESDPQFIKDYEKILESTEKKFEKFGDEWIKNMNETFGYETEYKNWKEATRYIERIIKASKYESKPTERN